MFVFETRHGRKIVQSGRVKGESLMKKDIHLPGIRTPESSLKARPSRLWGKTPAKVAGRDHPFYTGQQRLIDTEGR